MIGSVDLSYFVCFLLSNTRNFTCQMESVHSWVNWLISVTENAKVQLGQCAIERAFFKGKMMAVNELILSLSL